MPKPLRTEATLFADLPKPRDEQFRLRKMTVVNWGTFSQLHSFDVSEEGMLILGASGSGKTTLLDALSAMLVPVRKLRFNAAADTQDGRQRDRTVMTYVRGAWAQKGDEVTRDITKQLLRPDKTWSAVALEYRNRTGRCVTLVRVMWVNSAGMSAHLNDHYIIAEEPYDLAIELKEFDCHREQIKQDDRATIKHHRDKVHDYFNHLSRLFGIESLTALELLHRTQSAQNITDINDFLRRFMLAKPATFDVAERLVEEYQDLDEAHRSVIHARLQVEVLGPARDRLKELDQAAEATAANQALILAMESFDAKIQVGLLEAEIEQRTTSQQIAAGDQAEAEARISSLDREIASLEAQHAEQGGQRITGLEEDRRQQVILRDRASRTRALVTKAGRDLGWELADDPSAFAEQAAQARSLLNTATDRAESAQERDRVLAIQRHGHDEAFKTLRDEIRSLEQNASNVPIHLQRVRGELCAALGLSETKLPFAGELLAVKPEHIEWTGACERLLHGFGLSMLVAEADRRRVAAWVNERHLGIKLVYFLATSGQRDPDRDPGHASILRKLDVRPHAFAGWLQQELVDRFDYACVESAAELLKAPMRITIEGQIHHRGNRIEKDDRHNIKDPRHWVLGFDTREKLAECKRQAGDLAATIEAVVRQMRQLTDERQRDLIRERAAQVIADTEWTEIFVAACALAIDDIDRQLVELTSGNPQLADLAGRLASAREQRTTWANRRGEFVSQQILHRDRIRACTDEVRDARVRAAALPKQTEEDLRARLPATWVPNPKTFNNDLLQLERGLQDVRQQLARSMSDHESAILSAFRDYLRRWPAEQATLQPNLASAPDFMARLGAVEHDGLPVHEARFRDLLQTQSTQRLAELSKHLKEARHEITIKLEDVNLALETVPYNRDTYLKLRVVDLPHPDSRDFSRRVTDVLANQSRPTQDPEQAERQFTIISELVRDLSAPDAEKRRWRDGVLDVRQQVEFWALELARGTDEQMQCYNSTESQSGGQGQKLTATCMAAALRYQLGGVDGDVPQYAAVVLDEAFSKTDAEFTATCMRVFTDLGFQMIVATPTKSVMTLEEFVGGAVFVTITDRHTSGVLPITYDAQYGRLALPRDLPVDMERDDADA